MGVTALGSVGLNMDAAADNDPTDVARVALAAQDLTRPVVPTVGGLFHHCALRGREPAKESRVR